MRKPAATAEAICRAWGLTPSKALRWRFRPGDRVRVLRGPWAAETAGRDVMVLWSGVDPDADDITLAHWHESGVPVIISAPAADLSLVGEQLGLGFD